MKRRRGLAVGLLLTAGCSPATGTGRMPGSAEPSSRPEAGRAGAAAAAFWLARSSADREAAVRRLLGTGAGFGELYVALRKAPPYPADAARGRLDRSRVDSRGVPHPYTVLVPAGYDPARPWPVLFYLHGGVRRDRWRTPGSWWRDWDRIADPARIVVVPAGWRESMWWQESQTENLRAILQRLSAEYHIDPDRVHLIGVSDGGTGVFYQAFRAPTPWASFLSFIGHPAVLSNPRLLVDGEMFVSNLIHRPWFIVNGGRDRLYPVSSIEPFIRLFRESGIPLVFRAHPEAGHDLSWLPAEAARIDSFLSATPRDPLPESLEWETEDPSAGRFSWVVIDEILSPEDRLATAGPGWRDRHVLRVPGESGTILAFPHRRPSGRIAVERRGNEVRVRSRGVRRFRLLLSPEAFDFDLPVRVLVNGAERFVGRVAPDPGTLLRWASRDRDRSMLFAAELTIEPD